MSGLSEERTRPSALWLLIPLLITALIGGGVWTWLQSGLPLKKLEPPALALPARHLPTPIPAPLPNPKTDDLVAVMRPKPKAPRRKAPPPSPVFAVPQPAPEVPAGPLTLKATVSLEGGGDPSGIEVTVFGRSQWGMAGLHPDADGKVAVEVPKRENYHVVGKALGYAYATDSVDLERTPGKEGLLFLERLKRYQLDVVQLYREPGDLEAPAAHSTPLAVESGMTWRGVGFSQREGELQARGTTCVCIAHELGPVSAAALADVTVPPARQPSRCFFAMRVGEAFLVRPSPEEGWVVLRLREPGVESAPLPSSGRRVVTSISRQTER